jgi:Fur family zinc uptake transcriptional regulator
MHKDMPAAPSPDTSIPTALERVLRHCVDQRISMTPLRRRTLELLWQQPCPVSAYQVIRLLEEATGNRLKPPSICRILDFLVDHGLAARIESRNAYVACTTPERGRASVFLLCGFCDRSVEIPIPALARVIEMDTAAIGFTVSRPVMELHGICAACQDIPQAKAAS